jgi:hypothetical protein
MVYKPVVDHLFLLAVGALGWGLSLATYRELAELTGWPMGALQAERPAIPIGLGVASLAAAIAFAIARGGASGGWVIVLFGLALALFWSGFLRVGAQSALLLAPLATFALLVSWLAA